MVTRMVDCSRISRMRRSSAAVVMEPSTSDTSQGTAEVRAGGFEERGDSYLTGKREQFVFAIQQRQLTAVARRELPDPEGRRAHLESSSVRRSGSAISKPVTGPSLHNSSGLSWQ